MGYVQLPRVLTESTLVEMWLNILVLHLTDCVLFVSHLWAQWMKKG